MMMRLHTKSLIVALVVVMPLFFGWWALLRLSL